MLVQKLPKYMSKEEVERFLQKAKKSKRDLALFYTIYYYGLRVSEASNLNLEDLDLERNKIVIRRVKGGVSGEYPIPRDLRYKLNAYLKARTNNDSGLFTGKKGRLKVRRIEQLFKQYARRAKLSDEFTVHSLRHSIATHLLEDGQSLEYVQDHLGHKNIQNTAIYAKITNRKRQEAFRRMETSPAIERI
jgi:integrase/recombinase XerD